ncbi:MAG: hypothetical protein M3040_12735 [Bacteroidota bacterium]|nr:hypothetical protein [Bacteroidota bacterium]
MLAILFSKYSFVFYVLVINIEFAIKYTINKADSSKKLVILRLANFGSVLAVAILIFYTYLTVWWSFIGLIIVNVALFTVINSLFSFFKHVLATLSKFFKSYKTSW